MALLYRATLVPAKRDLVAAWLPSRPWAPPGEIGSGVSYRLDDPAGEVGLEGFLFTDSGGHSVHVPLTFRGQPLDGAEKHLLGTTEHSVLGTRWVYDGCGDPVWVATLAATIATGGTQAEEHVDDGEHVQQRDPKVRVRGSGSPGTAAPSITVARVSEDGSSTVLSGDGGELVVVRRVGVDPGCDLTLTATWAGEPGGVAIAGLRRA